MSDAGTAMMGIGIGSGRTAAEDAAKAAISSPLLDWTIDNAKGVVFNICGGPNLSLNEVNRAARLIYSTVEPDANVIFGALTDDTLDDSISITVLATGFSTKDSLRQKQASYGKGDLNDVKRAARKKVKEAEEEKEEPVPVAPPAEEEIPDFLRTLKRTRR
jgi:cell division protein FtsZ